MSATRGNAIPKLRGKRNYNLWKQAITDALTALDLWGYVSGQIEIPKQPDDFPCDRQSLLERMQFELQLSEWKNKDRDATQQIAATVPGWMASTLKLEQLATSKALFDELHERYNTDYIETLESWWDLTWDGSADMTEFLDEWTERLLKCFQVDVVFSENWQAYQLAWSVKDEGNDDVDAWARQVHHACEQQTVPPLHVLYKELVSITKKKT